MAFDRDLSLNGMKFGTHVSIAGGAFNAPENAAELGCEVFQMFTRSPRGGAAPELTPKIVKQFKENCKKHGFANYYVHAPYYVNLASAKPKIYNSSIRIIREELERSSKLGVTGMIIHVGSSKDMERKKALDKAVEGLKKIVTGYTGSTQFLLEIAAGSGNVIGDTFDEIAYMLKKIQPSAKQKIGICFDTAHAFASGYDLRTKKNVDTVIKEFDKKIGLDKLKLIHFNDSKVDFDAHIDRHEHIGKGKIGLAGFKALVNHPKLKDLDVILETPKEDDWDKKNLKTLKDIRNL